jgi:hypothetical protein
VRGTVPRGTSVTGRAPAPRVARMLALRPSMMDSIRRLASSPSARSGSDRPRGIAPVARLRASLDDEAGKGPSQSHGREPPDHYSMVSVDVLANQSSIVI